MEVLSFVFGISFLHSHNELCASCFCLVYAKLLGAFPSISSVFSCSLAFSSAPRRLLKLDTASNQRHSLLFNLFTKSFTSETIMSDKKRKATSAPSGKEPTAKQQKLVPGKEQEQKKKEGSAEGWLQKLAKQQRSENKEMKFNKQRRRFISEAEKIKQGSEGLLYWMSRDHRVQGDAQSTDSNEAQR